MKKFISLLFITVFSAFAFAAKEDILGTWITAKENDNQIIVEFYEKNGKIAGKIVSLTNRFDENGELKKDTKNPNNELKTRTLEGIDFVYGFDYNESKDNYINGSIYHPGEGKTYSCTIKIRDDGKLDVRGYVGIPLLGKTQVWEKY